MTADPTVRLRPITPAEFPAFVAASKAGYAEGIELHGGQTHEAAQGKAEAEFPAVLPLGLETPGHSIFIVEADGAAVGRLWLAERDMAGRRILYVYDISIHPEHQGRGYGRAATVSSSTCSGGTTWLAACTARSATLRPRPRCGRTWPRSRLRRGGARPH